MHQKFGKRAAFLFIYLREAHPSDGWAMGPWSSIEDPTTLEGRSKTARMCTESVQFQFPTLVDPMDDRTAVRWAAWPERLFVIDRKGVVVYAGGQGPWEFWPTKRYRMAARKRGSRSQPTTISLEEFLESFWSSNDSKN